MTPVWSTWKIQQLQQVQWPDTTIILYEIKFFFIKYQIDKFFNFIVAVLIYPKDA